MSNAKLKFIFGSMGSAKSLRLLTTAYNMEERGIQIMVLKPMADTRQLDHPSLNFLDPISKEIVLFSLLMFMKYSSLKSCL